MLGYWPYATHKKTCFLDICIFVTLHRKPGILNTRLIYIFLQNKKNSDLKINIPENHKSLSLSFIFFKEKKKKKKTACPAGSLAQASDPVWTQKKERSLLNEQGKMHANRPRYCSSELKFT